MTDRPAMLLEDILAGPGALAGLIDAYAHAAGPMAGLDPARLAGRRFVFSGLGSSYYAGLTAAARLRAMGAPAWAEPASATSPTPPAFDVVFVATSASGRTPEVIEAARRHRGTSLVIGVTNDPGAPLATDVDVVLPLLAGEERSGFATRTFRATAAVLSLLADWSSGRDHRVDALRRAVEALAEAIEHRETWLEATAELLDHSPAVDVIGDSGDLGTISQAALMLREGPRLPAQAHDAGDWAHTAIYLALPGHRALLFSGTSYDESIVRTVAGRGGKSVTVGPPVEGAAMAIPAARTGDAVGDALVRSVVAELLAAELWRRANAVDR